MSNVNNSNALNKSHCDCDNPRCKFEFKKLQNKLIQLQNMMYDSRMESR